MPGRAASDVTEYKKHTILHTLHKKNAGKFARMTKKPYLCTAFMLHASQTVPQKTGKAAGRRHRDGPFVYRLGREIFIL